MQYLLQKTSHSIVRETNGTHYRPHRKVRVISMEGQKNLLQMMHFKLHNSQFFMDNYAYETETELSDTLHLNDSENVHFMNINQLEVLILQ
jgi:hypothetical protein